MRVANYLSAQNVPFDPLAHAPAFCASRRARWLRTPGQYVARAVLLVGPDGYLLAVLRSTHEIDLTELARRFPGPLRLARIDEAVEVFRDCEWGAVPAFGNLYGLPTVLDAGMDSDDEIVFEIGSHFADVLMTCGEFERLTGACRVDFARPLTRHPAAP
jgi:Ala-tRNA(Pro) deacylase